MIDFLESSDVRVATPAAFTGGDRYSASPMMRGGICNGGGCVGGIPRKSDGDPIADPEDDFALETGAIIGIFIGAIVGVIMIWIGIYLCCCQKKRRHRIQSAPETPADDQVSPTVLPGQGYGYGLGQATAQDPYVIQSPYLGDGSPFSPYHPGYGPDDDSLEAYPPGSMYLSPSEESDDGRDAYPS
jgi:hypothetical protein